MATKVKAPVTEEKKFEMALNADLELVRTVKQSRDLERSIMKFGSGAKMAKFLRLHDVLKDEQLNVVLDLVVATNPAKTKNDDDLSANLTDLLTQSDELEIMIKKKKAFLTELTSAVALQQKKVDELSARLPSEYQLHQRLVLAQTTYEGLENKLCTAMKQYGMLTTDNRLLREDINHMLIERTSFNKIWYTYLGNLIEGKSVLMDIIEQATIAYDQRDEWIFRLNALRSFAYNGLIKQTEEMASLQKQFDNNKALEEFIAVKEQYRNMEALEARKIMKRNQQREILKKTLDHHNLVLGDIQAFSGLELPTSVSKFITKFTATEAENMSTFVYITQLRSQIEATTEVVMTLQEKIDSQMTLNKNRAVQQIQTLQELRKTSGIATNEADAAQNGLTSTNKTLSNFFTNIAKLFKICKCSNAPFLELLGDNTSINNYNVLLHLEILEQGVSELLTNVYYKQRVKVKGKVAPSIVNDVSPAPRKHEVDQFAPTNPCPLCVDRELVSDVIDSLQCVQSRDQVEKRLKERLKFPDGLERLHNVSACNLPKSRQIIQRRYQ